MYTGVFRVLMLKDLIFWTTSRVFGFTPVELLITCTLMYLYSIHSTL